MGARALDLGAAADVDSDGAVDIVLPVQNRRQFALVSVMDGAFVERWRGEPVAAIGGNVSVTADKSGFVINYRAKAGQAVELKVERAQLQ